MITLSDPAQNTALQTLIKNSSTITALPAAQIEYNLNSMVDNIQVTHPGITYQKYEGADAYKKLFPVDSIVKPFRPVKPGVKYHIYTTNNTDTPSKSYSSIKSLQYPSNQPRLYYAGENTYYKYWASPKDTNASIKIVYPKDIYTNKVVVRFEKYHAVPTSWTITGKTSTGTTVFTQTGTAVNSNGEAIIHLSSSGWSTTAPATYATPVAVRELTLTAVNPMGGKILGIIEFSPRWVVDITSDIVYLEIVKESTGDTESIIPVGNITANSVSITTSKLNQLSKNIIEYNRAAAFDPTKLYLVKNAEIRSYLNVINGATTYTLPQGTFYMSSWNMSEFDEVTINGLDGAKFLQETIAPEVLCEGYLATAVIRRLLDAVGFTNYNFNLEGSDLSVPFIKYWWSEDTKTIWQCLQELCRDIQMNAFFDEYNTLQFYSRQYMYNQTDIKWTFRHKPSGSELPNIVSLSQKEIASANQVKVLWNAPVSSEYNGSAGPLWKSDTTFLGASALAGTIDADDMEIVLNPSVVNYYQNVRSLFSYTGYLLVDSEIIEYDAIQYQYTPKLLPDGSDNNGDISYPIWITSQADTDKYRFLSKPGYRVVGKPESAYFATTNRYRIKTRGAFGTTPAIHTKAPEDVLSSWEDNIVSWS